MRTNTLIGLALFAIAVGCGKDKNKNDAGGKACFSNSDCGDNDACFLGTCVPAGSGLGTVDIDVQPAATSTALRQRLSRTFDGSSGAQDLTLAPTITLPGVIDRTDGILKGTLSIDLVSDGPCPDLTASQNAASTDDTLSYQTTITDTTFSLAAVPGHYRVIFMPDPTTLRPPVVQPNNGACGEDLADGSTIEIDYPSEASLVFINGRVRYSVDDVTGVAGAQVTIIAVDDSGGTYTSATIETNSDGTFSLAVPPGGVDYSVHVHGGSNANVPDIMFPGLTPTAGNLGDLVLDISAPESVAVTVVDGTGAPATDTTVTASGVIGGGLLTVSDATSATGMMTLSLHAGTYTLLATPRTSAAAGLARMQITVIDGQAPAPVTMVVPPKAQVSGTVVNSAGTAVANARVTYRLLDLSTDREVTATTDSTGAYALSVDSVDPAGNTLGAEYEVTVEPPGDSRDPRHREFVRIAGDTTQDIQLFGASFIYGTLYAADGTPLPNAAMLFYSQLSGDVPVLVGVSQTNPTGEFAVPLPEP